MFAPADDEPLDADVLREDLFQRGLADAASAYGELVAAFGEYLEGATLVLPDDEHFPDAVAPTLEGVETLLRRVLSYTPLDEDEPLALVVAGGEDASCSSGACGPALAPVSVRDKLVAAPAGASIPIHPQDVGSPARLMAHLAWAAGALLLATEPRLVGHGAAERAVRAEIAAVACGLGPLLLGGSHVVLKGCGGVRVHRGTALPTDILAGLIVLFAAHHDDARGLRRARRLAEATQAEALDRAVEFFAKRPRFSAEFRADPTSIALHCDFGPEEGLLGRLFGGRAAGLPVAG